MTEEWTLELFVKLLLRHVDDPCQAWTVDLFDAVIDKFIELRSQEMSEKIRSRV